jgi:hypothetical protein
MKRVIKLRLIAGIIHIFCFYNPVSAQQIDGMGMQKPFMLRGNFATNFIGYGVSGIDSRMNPFAMMLSANATASVYGISVPFSVRYSNQRVNYTQPFNQLGLSPSYKWITAHAGYRNITFSNYTMAGHSFLGGGVELKPGKFRFGFVYGRFKKNTTAFEQAIDTTQTLTRKGFGARIGVGSEHTYVDLILLKIRDDSTSIINPLNPAYVPAEENAVAGINSKIRLSKNLFFDAEVAASIYTTDISAMGFTSSDENIWLKRVNNIITINHSTELLTAVRAALNYRLQKVNTRLEYRRIDPGYRSMGAYFMNNDIENLTIAPSFSLFNRKLNLRGSLGLQRDNLRNAKRATSLRTISSFQASYNPVPLFGLDISYSNYSSNQRAGRVPLIDSLKLYQTTSNLNITPRLLINGTNYNHMIIAMISRMELNDRNIFTQDFTNNQATIFNLNYNLGLLQHKASVLLGFNYNLLKNAVATVKASGISLGASKSMLEGRAQVGINNSIIRTQQSQSGGWTINTSVNSGYQLSRKQTIRFNLFFIRSAYPNGTLTNSFNEIKGDMSYVYTF